VLSELARLTQLGWIGLGLEDPELEAAFAGVHVWPLVPVVAR
jgi:hypothetical protein